MTYDLIIFDCDGTLVDSEYLHNKVVADLLTGMGYSKYDVAYTLNAFAGKGMGEVVRTVEEEIGQTLPASFIPDYVRQVNERLHELMRPIEGVLETIHHCNARVKICIGSNGEHDNVLALVNAAGLGPYFPPQTIFTKDMVTHAKPAPDLFLHAAEKMGVSPARTLVIEDSVTGATAGIAAGMTVIGFTATAHDRAAQEKALRAAGVGHIIDRFVDISLFIDAEFKGLVA
jgi:HAD superfamily hydrolase (TIGR01509 family)